MGFETRRGRRRRIRRAGFLPAWRDLLAERMAHWAVLDDAERARLERRTLDLLVGPRWEAADGFTLTEEMQVLIAAQAALIALGLPDDCYRGVTTIIVHPTTMVLRGPRVQVPGVVSDGPAPIIGQASDAGPVVIAWDAARCDARHPERGHDVVYHEFAHALDRLDGVLDGTPPLGSDERLRRWVEVCTAVYERVQPGDDAVLGAYAGVNPAEFFAVATEAFFDRPLALRDAHPDLYEVLAGFYRQDPVAWAERGPRTAGGA